MMDLNTKEQQAVKQILNELLETGNSKYYNELLHMDYDEIPVDIHTFLHNPRYLGKGLVNDEGRFTVFPLLGRNNGKNISRPFETC